MTTTLANLRDRLEDMVHRDDIANTDIEKFCINAAIRLIDRRDIFRLSGTVDTTLSSSAITSGDVGVLSFTLPTDFRAFRSLVQTAPSNKSGFAKLTWELANMIWRANTTLSSTDNDIFQAVVVEGTSLYLYPRYSATSTFSAGTFTYTLYYDAWLTELSAESDSNYITNYSPDLVVFISSALILVYLRELDTAVNMINLANGLIGDFQLSEKQSTDEAGKLLELGDLQKLITKITAAQKGSNL